MGNGGIDSITMTTHLFMKIDLQVKARQHIQNHISGFYYCQLIFFCDFPWVKYTTAKVHLLGKEPSINYVGTYMMRGGGQVYYSFHSHCVLHAKRCEGGVHI